VRSVLGEAGTGWCVLEEVRDVDHTTDMDAMEDAFSEFTADTGMDSPAEHIDPAASFVLPTLDFSASFARETDSWAGIPQPTRAGLSDLEFHNTWSASQRDQDGDSDTGSLSDFSDSLSDVDVDGVESVWERSPLLSRRSSSDSSREGWTTLGFSSSFAGRIQADTRFDESQEELF
jgi:hypothetical protein